MATKSVKLSAHQHITLLVMLSQEAERLRNVIVDSERDGHYHTADWHKCRLSEVESMYDMFRESAANTTVEF